MNLKAIVLAAGKSSRFGSNKLTAEFRGEPLLHHAIRAAKAAPVAEVLVIAHPDTFIGEWAGAPPVRAVHLASSALSESLRAGIAAAGDVDGVFVYLGDMPLVPHAISGALAKVLGDHYAALPRHAGRPGHPALLSRKTFADLADLQGDAGAGRVLKEREDVVYLDCDSPYIHADVDMPADLERLCQSSDVRRDQAGRR